MHIKWVLYPVNKVKMKFSIILRFVFLGALWLFLCYLLLATARPVTFYTWFVIFASAVIIFVPMYKKYVSNSRKH